MSEFEPFEQAEAGEKEPTSKEIADACSEVLDVADCNEIASLPPEEAIIHAFQLLLIIAEIEDPETFLKEKNIL